jgi:hypothetical protein
LLLQAVCDGDTDATSEMVVTAARKFKVLGLPVVCLPARGLKWADRCQVLKCEGHMGAGQPIIAVPSLRFDREKAAGKEFA